MKKVCLVAQEKSKNEALKKLRDVGVLHIEKSDTPIDNNSAAVKNKVKVDNAIGLISEYKQPKQKKSSKITTEKDDDSDLERRHKTAGLHRGRRAEDVFGTEDEEPFSLNAVRADVRPYLPDLIVGFGEERKELNEQDVTLSREISRIEGWGNFDPSILEEINDYGVPVYLYEISLDAFSRLDENIKYIKLKGEKSIVRLLVFDEKIPGINPFTLPEKSLGEYIDEWEKVKIALTNIDDKIKGFSNRKPSLDKEIEKIEQDLEFEIAHSSLKKVDGIPEELALCWLTGYIPIDDLDKVEKAALENGWAMTSYDPSPDDAPPTKLAGNPVSRLLHPLLYLLGTIPGYKEFDISPSYLFFFSIFFAMILGDAGYGVLIFTLALAIGVTGKIKTGIFPDISKLLIILTSCTIIWGAINGSWFAIPHEHLPAALKMLIIPQFNGGDAVVAFPSFLQGIFKTPEVIADKTQWNIQFLCFFLAVVQLVYARGKRIISEIKSLTAVAQFGMLIMMLGLYFLVLNMLLGMELPFFAVILILGGLGLNLLFAEQKGGNFFANIGKGLGNSFQLFLKAVSCFADIISYIRLFAVGLAGAIIAQIVNDMAVGGGLGSIGVMFFVNLLIAVLIIVIGHALNLVLTALSVIVHGVRLNLLEYAGNHLEMDWSGYLYKPFALRKKKE
ncbi:MAG: V-type ATP synthase subunit I [Treponema sp.]|nr:V-type ATP synthase subunit I [Treponema sp.]